jgi:activating signal cointegrator complex subunit 3
VTDVLQMIGRAGRPQFDTEAKAVVLVHEPKKNFYLNFLHSPFPVESSLLSQLHDHVNAEICSSGTIKCVGDFLDYLSWTFLFRRLLLNPSYYGLQATDSETLNAFLANLVRGVLGDLEVAGLIAHDAETAALRPLALGKIASQYYLKYTTMTVFSERLTPDAGLPQLLEVLAHAREFEELPVRHNEDKMNAELARAVRWPVNSAALDDPHTKTHLLLQSHLDRLSLPVSDYYTDLKSVLDQAIRVLQAMVDTLCEAGWLSAALQCMTLMQMVVQGRWADDSFLANLPGTAPGSKAAASMAAEGFASSIPKLLAADKGKLANIMRKAHATEKETNDFIEAVRTTMHSLSDTVSCDHLPERLHSSLCCFVFSLVLRVLLSCRLVASPTSPCSCPVLLAPLLLLAQLLPRNRCLSPRRLYLCRAVRCCR